MIQSIESNQSINQINTKLPLILPLWLAVLCDQTNTRTPVAAMSFQYRRTGTRPPPGARVCTVRQSRQSRPSRVQAPSPVGQKKKSQVIIPLHLHPPNPPNPWMNLASPPSRQVKKATASQRRPSPQPEPDARRHSDRRQMAFSDTGDGRETQVHTQGDHRQALGRSQFNSLTRYGVQCRQRTIHMSSSPWSVPSFFSAAPATALHCTALHAMQCNTTSTDTTTFSFSRRWEPDRDRLRTMSSVLETVIFGQTGFYG